MHRHFFSEYMHFNSCNRTLVSTSRKPNGGEEELLEHENPIIVRNVVVQVDNLLLRQGAI